jgi:hypothetical protein
MNDLNEKLMALRVSSADKRKAMIIFIESYHVHRDRYGSLKYLIKENMDEYDKEMKKRAEFMFDEALKSIGYGGGKDGKSDN